MVGFPMPAGLNESMSLAIQIGRRLRERKPVHHLAVLPELKPEPMQCDRTLTRVERQEHRRLNGLCFYCGDSTHAISDCPKRTKRFARSATIGTVQSKFLLSVTLICSLSSYSVMAFVDSGAALNLMDLEYAKRCGFFLEPLQCPIPLRGIDATPLAKNKPQYWTQLTICMAPAHQEVIRFLVLHNLHDVVVLGLPWLQAHNPVLDWKSMSVSSWGCQGVHGDVPFLSISSSTPSEVPEFLSDYRDVFDEPKSNTLPPHRDCDCAINLIPGSKFPKGRLFNLSVPEHTAMRSYVKESLEKGHIRPSSSPLGAGFFFVAKKDGSLRPCIDYRLLNKITVKFQYPLPLLSDLFARIKGASWFTKIDLRGAYNLVRIKQGDEWKTAFNTPEGHFEYLVMPFGLANAPSVFQSFMHDIFREYLDKFLIVYLDDILIFSDDWESHVKQVESSDCPGVDTVVDRLQQIWTQLNYLGPPFNDPDFNPPRAIGPETIPSASVDLHMWRNLNDSLRLAENHRAYSVLLCYLRSIDSEVARTELRRSLGRFCTSLQGLVVSIAGVMSSLGYNPPPEFATSSPPPGLGFGKGNDFLRKMEDFWLLKELQIWLWRSAKDFNRLKRKVPAVVAFRMDSRGF
ncbi:unnamed protein product [Ranitomeya imitator]|uniref:ribonuclease H n=1 Tax=Ranitomeya imitator TaxID=111125 RepID=A0ABN9LRU9_9NEOB|nr:unnamed protein product [Ranitomeya imitator]